MQSFIFVFALLAVACAPTGTLTDAGDIVPDAATLDAGAEQAPCAGLYQFGCDDVECPGCIFLRNQAQLEEFAALDPPGPFASLNLEDEVQSLAPLEAVALETDELWIADTSLSSVRLTQVRVNELVGVVGNQGLTTIVLPRLQAVTSIWLSGNEALASFSAEGLLTVASFEVSLCPSLCHINLGTADGAERCQDLASLQCSGVLFVESGCGS